MITSLTPEIVLLDQEASGLGMGSYPIEIGWCVVSAADGALLSGPTAYLINPAITWDPRVWDDMAEDIHGISQQELDDDGLSVTEVAQLVSEAARDRVILVTSEMDIGWLNKLFQAAREHGYVPERRLDVRNFSAELAFHVDPGAKRLAGMKGHNRLAQTFQRINKLEREADKVIAAQGLRRHRAGADALHMAAWWKMAVEEDWL